MRNPSFLGCELFVIGTSAGGVDMLSAILPAFRKTNKFKVAVVIHMPPTGPNLIPSLMNEICDLDVCEGTPGEKMRPDHIYIAPPDYHLSVENDGTLSLSTEGPQNFSRPSIDILFESAAFAYQRKTIGILLTGANNDGAHGLKRIQEMGGVTIVQDPSDAHYETMPLSALEIMKPDLVLKTTEMTELIAKLCGEGKAYV